MTRWMAIAAVLACVASAPPMAEAEDVTTALSKDGEEILAHIHSIFQAFLRQDRDAIRRAHSADWTGFQGPSTKIERGIDDYMKNAEASLQKLRGTGYELLDTEVQLYGDMALVYYVARYDFKDKQGRAGSLPLRSIDVYRREAGHWTQCGSHITPMPTGGKWGEGSPPGPASATADGPTPRELPDPESQELLAAREAVWRAWFAADEAALSTLIPQETIAIDPDVAEWADPAEITRRARAFAAEGGKLTRLEFPQTRIQAYGNVAILYTQYVVETERGGERRTTSGRGTEIFVRRGGRWLNSGWHLGYFPAE